MFINSSSKNFEYVQIKQRHGRVAPELVGTLLEETYVMQYAFTGIEPPVILSLLLLRMYAHFTLLIVAFHRQHGGTSVFLLCSIQSWMVSQSMIMFILEGFSEYDLQLLQQRFQHLKEYVSLS